jgi:chlorite dismutase
MSTPPETLEGWYALHQIFRVTGRLPQHAAGLLGPPPQRRENYPNGWSARVDLIGSRAHLMMIHFYPTLEAIAAAQARMDKLSADGKWNLEPVYTFLSVTEAGLYHITAELSGDPEKLAKRIEAEASSDHVKRRLFPQPPTDMPYVCFYPMSKRRDPEQNWYTLSLEERSRLMHAHGLTGRRYAGRIQQVITGAIGLDAWEWGVTLFAKDPLDFKKLVTDMRFDEVSAKYAEFGEFFVGKLIGIL